MYTFASRGVGGKLESDEHFEAFFCLFLTYIIKREARSEKRDERGKWKENSPGGEGGGGWVKVTCFLFLAQKESSCNVQGPTLLVVSRPQKKKKRLLEN